MGGSAAHMLLASSSNMDLSQVFDIPLQVGKEVEDEANTFFQRIYNNDHNNSSINEVLEQLRRYHGSSVKKQRDVYACMLRNLFEEYKFFPTYPPKELLTTAKLLGGLIDQRLIE